MKSPQSYLMPFLTPTIQTSLQHATCYARRRSQRVQQQQQKQQQQQPLSQQQKKRAHSGSIEGKVSGSKEYKRWTAASRERASKSDSSLRSLQGGKTGPTFGFAPPLSNAYPLNNAFPYGFPSGGHRPPASPLHMVPYPGFVPMGYGYLPPPRVVHPVPPPLTSVSDSSSFDSPPNSPSHTSSKGFDLDSSSDDDTPSPSPKVSDTGDPASREANS